MDKSHIVAEIKRITLAHDGKVPGREKFESESGIRISEWCPHLWLRWGDTRQEAGFEPNKLAAALSNELVIEKYIELIRELERIPLRVRETEFFTLDASDVAAFTCRKYH